MSPEFIFPTDEFSYAEFESSLAKNSGMIFVQAVLTLLLILLAQGATTHVVARHYLGQKINVMAGYRRAFPKLWIMVISGLLMLIAFSLTAPLMFILIGIPLLIFLVVSWSFVFQLVMIEGAGPVSALGGSYNLVKGSRWRVLGIGIVFVLINFGLQILMTIVTGIIDNSSQPLASAFSVIGLALLAPLMYIGLTVVYFDLRARKQAFTLDSLAAELG